MVRRQQDTCKGYGIRNHQAKDTLYAKVLGYLFVLRFAFSRLQLLAVHWRYIHFFLRFGYTSHFVTDMWWGWRNDRDFPGNRGVIMS